MLEQLTSCYHFTISFYCPIKLKITRRYKPKHPAVGQKVNWVRVVCRFSVLFYKEEKRHGRDQCRGEGKTTRRCWVGLVVTDWHTSRLRSEETRCEDDRHDEKQQKPVGGGGENLSSRPPFPLSHALFLSLHALIAFVEERKQTRTDPWSQMLVNPSTSFFYLFISSSFSVVTPHHGLHATPEAACGFFYANTQFTMSVGPAGVIICL